MPYQMIGLQAAQVRKVFIHGRLVPSAMYKTARQGAMAVGLLGLEVDEQADLSVHGGLEKALYAYPSEHYDFWRAERQSAAVASLSMV